MIRAIVDTNVWVSAVLNPAGKPAQILSAWVKGRFVALVPDMVVAEIRDVMARGRIRRRLPNPDADAANLVKLILEAAEIVPSGGGHFGCRDPKDDALLDAAASAAADVIVTRDDDMKRDLELMQRMSRAGVAVVSVSAFLELLDPPPGPNAPS